MRKQRYLFLLLATMVMTSKAAPGDTTWVQAQNNIQLNYYNNFDAPVAFPNGSTAYRKIIMEFTLGKYQCAATEQYCGDWDYTVQNFLITPTDTFELARLITPYANASYPRTPFTWKQRYYFDVTDFYPVLKNSATLRLLYQGYSGGFTANIRFAFIEGTPPRNVVGIKHLWHGAFNYGNTADPIENHLPAIAAVAPAGTQSTDLKFTVTGHGSDNQGCSEFCSKYYQVYNGTTYIEQKQIWKDDCGLNDLYPQSGTWLYDRANWCPGQLVNPNVHKFGAVATGAILNPDVNFQTYTSNVGSNPPNYIIDGTMFFYGAYNQPLDAALERIISPSDYEGNFRANPICGKPVVHIRNTGTTTLTSVSFQYGVAGYSAQTYTATSLSLASMAETDITLPDLAPLNSMPFSSNARFSVTITQVNGVADTYATNNSMTSNFINAPDWPASFAVSLRSNNYYTETSWKLENLAGATIMSRTPTAALTFYTDQVTNLPAGCYKLTVTDTECDGLYWWANASSTNLGAFFVRSTDLSTFIPFTNGLPTPNYNGTSINIPTASQDFGCGFTQYFRVGAALPLSLLSFTGYGDENNANHLAWKTTDEVNTSHFEIEYSTDGNYFTKIADKPAAGNATGQKTYSLLHTPAAKANLYYYRLKMVDKDGQYKYSNTITIKTHPGNFAVTSVSPVPFDNRINLTVTTAKAAILELSLLDVQGRVQYRRTIAMQEGINNLQLTGLDKLSKGVYLLQTQSNGQTIIQKILKGQEF